MDRRRRGGYSAGWGPQGAGRGTRPGRRPTMRGLAFGLVMAALLAGGAARGEDKPRTITPRGTADGKVRMLLPDGLMLEFPSVAIPSRSTGAEGSIVIEGTSDGQLKATVRLGNGDTLSKTGKSCEIEEAVGGRGLKAYWTDSMGVTRPAKP